jgi:hypothetical protein
VWALAHLPRHGVFADTQALNRKAVGSKKIFLNNFVIGFFQQEKFGGLERTVRALDGVLEGYYSFKLR